MNFLFPENQKILEKLNQKEFELDSLTLAHSYLSDEYERVLNSKVRLILPGTYCESCLTSHVIFKFRLFVKEP